MASALGVKDLVQKLLHVYSCAKLGTLKWMEIDNITGASQLLYEIPWVSHYETTDKDTGIRVVIQGKRNADKDAIIDYRMLEGHIVQICLFNLHLESRIKVWIHDVHWTRDYEFAKMHELDRPAYIKKVSGWEEHRVIEFPDEVLPQLPAKQCDMMPGRRYLHINRHGEKEVHWTNDNAESIPSQESFGIPSDIP